jgi:hypothetical protein
LRLLFLRVVWLTCFSLFSSGGCVTFLPVSWVALSFVARSS